MNTLFNYNFSSPVIVEADADIAQAAQRIAEGKWLNCGQVINIVKLPEGRLIA